MNSDNHIKKVLPVKDLIIGTVDTIKQASSKRT